MIFRRKKTFFNDLFICMNSFIIKQYLPKVAYAFLLLSLQSSYGVERSFQGLAETPLGFYKSDEYCQCGSIAINRELPKSYFIDSISPVKDQGPLGTCASFATVACGEHYYPHVNFSEAEFTVLAQTNKVYGNGCQGGLFLGKALKFAQQYGFVEEERFPYDYYLEGVARKNGIDTRHSDWKTRLGKNEEAYVCDRGDYNQTMHDFGVDIQLTGSLAEDCSPYRFIKLYAIHHVSKDSVQTALDRAKFSYQNKFRGRGNLSTQFSSMGIAFPARSNGLSRGIEPIIGTPLDADIQSIKKALYCNLPVAAAINVYGDWSNAMQGRIKMPVSITGDDSHAVVLTGFNDSDKLFKFKNSWGQDWGDSGFGYLPYDYVKLYATELVAVAK